MDVDASNCTQSSCTRIQVGDLEVIPAAWTMGGAGWQPLHPPTHGGYSQVIDKMTI